MPVETVRNAQPGVEDGKQTDLDEELFDENDVVLEKAKSVAINKQTSLTNSAGSSMASLVHINKSSDALSTNYDDLDLEFESFNGSLADNVEQKRASSIKESSTTIFSPTDNKDVNDIEEFNFVSPKLSSNNLISLSGKSSAQAAQDTNATMDSTAGSNVDATTSTSTTEPELNVLKTRDLNVITQSYSRKSSNFKAVKIDNKQIPVTEIQSKIKELTKVCHKYDHKIKKIGQEIEYLDYLYTNTPSMEEISKLRRARDALSEKLESVKKEKYNTSVKLNHMIMKSPEIQGGEYWSRTVS